MTDELMIRVSGLNAKDAFNTAKAEDDQLRLRTSFQVISVPSGVAPLEFANDIFDDPALVPFVHDATAPLGCINLGGGEYLFVGVQGAG